MTLLAPGLRAFFDANPTVALVEVVDAKGSTPRDEGAWMLVSVSGIFGTIGGGQLEYMAIDRARQLLDAGQHLGDRLSIPLGPEIGQCCGGRVELALRVMDARLRAQLVSTAEADDASAPQVFIFGGGHVGHALAAAFALLPVRAVVVETRGEALAGLPDGVELRLVPMPEEVVREAPAGSAFLILTHDHALDFLIVAEALKRQDAAYVGMIGSRTKRATFRSWYLDTAGGDEASLRRLVSPIGGSAVDDKRPAVIAALATAEVITALAGHVRAAVTEAASGRV